MKRQMAATLLLTGGLALALALASAKAQQLTSGTSRRAVTRVRATDMAFAMRQPGYEVDVSSNWSAPEEKDSAVRWAKALRDKLQPLSHGLYVNGLSETSDELVRAAYGPNYARLVQIKKKYDPANVLRLNQNIKPGLASNN